ncbi:hypothetical protein [Prosthecobacter sp.]|uniref:hypothetical protein n=1 Tax=Prosthecobacter sp. TaxID=1965333 RepID=UPI003784A1AC
MKLLERNWNQENKLVGTGSARHFERPTWLVTCEFKRREIIGHVFTQARYEVAARTEAAALESVRSFVLQTHPESCIESLQATRH